MNKTEEFRNQEHIRPVILMITGGLGAGGKEQQLLSLLKGLKEHGKFSIILVSMNPNGLREFEARNYVDQLINIQRSRFTGFFSPLFKVVKIARKYNATLIHTWGSGIWDVLGLLVAQLIKVPFLHGGIRSAPSSLNLNNRLSKWSAKHADAVVANSQAGLQAFGQQDNPKAKVIYNGLDLERFEGIEDISPDQYDLCMVANFSAKKDHQTLIKSMTIITEAYPEARLLLVGHDAGTLNQTRMLVEGLDLTNSVVFVTDCLKPYQFIANSKICVLSTYGEGISNAILEYFAFSKPVVATNVAGNSEIIESGKNGYLVEAGSAEPLAERVISLFENPDLAKQIGTQGRDLATSKFDIGTMVGSFESVYSCLIDEIESG